MERMMNEDHGPNEKCDMTVEIKNYNADKRYRRILMIKLSHRKLLESNIKKMEMKKKEENMKIDEDDDEE